MIKKFLALALTLTLGLSSCTSDDVTPVLPKSGIKIDKGVLSAYPEKEIMPTELVSLPEVTEIADKVFENNTRLKEIHAPGIKKIGAGAFKGCIGLVKVDFGGAQRPPLAIDETDKEFGTAADAFWNTPEDKVLVFNEANSPNFLQYFEYIARHHFAKLDGIKIPAELDSKAFDVKNGVLKGIRHAGQSYLAGLGKNGVLVLPSSIKRIEGGVFSDKFQNFKAIYAEGVEEIGNYAFNATASLNFAHLPKLKSLGEGCFLDNASLRAVNFPKLEEIGHICFNGGSNISGNGLNITYISLPAVKKIGRGAFHGNYKNSGVAVLLGAMPQVDFTPYSDDDPFHDGHVAFGQMKDPVLYVTPANKETYQITNGKWMNFTVKELK